MVCFLFVILSTVIKVWTGHKNGINTFSVCLRTNHSGIFCCPSPNSRLGSRANYRPPNMIKPLLVFPLLLSSSSTADLILSAPLAPSPLYISFFISLSIHSFPDSMFFFPSQQSLKADTPSGAASKKKFKSRSRKKAGSIRQDEW